MVTNLRPWTGVKGLRPAGAFLLNHTSQQARQLTACFPLVGPGRQRDLVHGLVLTNSELFQGIVPQLNWGQNRDGSTSALVSAPKDLFDLTPTFTLALRFRPNAATNSDRGLAGDWGSSGFMLYLASATNPRAYVGDVFASGSTSITDTSHVYDLVETWDGATIRLYVDGRLDATAAATVLNATGTNFDIGTYQDDTTRTVNGVISDVRFYNKRCWTPQEVWAYTDPATRWELYVVPPSRVFFNVGAAAVARANRLALLGVA